MVRISFPKTEADYDSITFQVQNTTRGLRYLTAQASKRVGGSTTVHRIFYENARIDTTNPVQEQVMSQVVTILSKKDPGCIAIDRTKNILSIAIKRI